MTNITWDSGYETANYTLTGSSLIATCTSAGGGVRAISGQASGKYYFEITINTLNALTFLGLQPSSVANTTLGGYSTLTGVGLRVSNNSASVTGTLVGSSLGTAANGTVACFAVDLDNRAIWVRYGAAGNWNGSAGNSPTTPSTGASFATFAPPGVSLLPFAFSAGASQVTANFGDSAFTGAVPAGYTSGVPNTGVTNALVTQIGSEAWASNPSVARFSQIGSDVWVNPIPALRLTQAGVEIWSVNSPALYVSQVGVEAWVSVAQGAMPGAGALTITGFAPISGTNLSASPAAGAVTVTGFAPSVAFNSAVSPAAGSIVVSGFAPSATSDTVVSPGAGAIVFTGATPTVDTTVAPAAGAITLTGFAPSPIALAAGGPMFSIIM